MMRLTAPVEALIPGGGTFRSKLAVTSNYFRPITFTIIERAIGRGNGVGQALGVGVGLGVTVEAGLGVELPVEVGVAVGVDVAMVAVPVGVVVACCAVADSLWAVNTTLR
jgi:hypothetical protein